MSQTPYQRLLLRDRQNFFETPSTLTKTSWSAVEEVASCGLLVTGEDIRRSGE
jgi:hypothetical protein